MKKKLLLVAFIFIGILSFVNGQSFRLDGNAHVFSWNDLKSIHEQKQQGKIQRMSADGLCNWFDSISDSCGNNSLLRDQKLNEAKNTLFVVYGRITLVRRSILDEYIVELNSNSFMNVSIVYPKRIS